MIQKVKKTAALATLTVFGTVTLAQAADTWAVEGYEILEAQTATTALSHSDEVTWSAFDTTFLALSHADQIIWHEEEKKKLATFSHGDVITWDCPKPAQVAAIN